MLRHRKRDMATFILGISAFYHDSAACLIRDGVIVAAAQEERFSRQKNDAKFPKQAIAYCLSTAGIEATDLELVAFYDKPLLKFERILETHVAFAPTSLTSFLKAIPVWLKEKLWMEETIKKELGFEGPVLFPEHHQSHAASAFYPSPFDRAAVLTIDGVGEWATTSWGIGNGNELEAQGELRFPHSVGLLYSAFTYYTGFRVNSGEYKVMGLAPYGEPVYKSLILNHLLDLKEDGSFRMDMRYFNYCQGLTMTSKLFHKLFGGPPRSPESEITQRTMDLARSIQEVVEEIVLRMARHIKNTTGEENLCIAGGVALNCVANGKLQKEQLFKNIWIQPAAGDAGGSLGAALYAWHAYLGKPRQAPVEDAQFGSYLGPAYDSSSIAEWASRHGLVFTEHTEAEITEITASRLATGQIGGWFSGRMEFGPRALGGRSILGDARNAEMQYSLNMRIKYRESFRPFAPICLQEDLGDYFELDAPSPYMLMVAPVVSDRRIPRPVGVSGIDLLKHPLSDIPAVTHVDYSARIQTVDGKYNPRLHALLTEFKKQTGSGILVNTSFNVRGEPIVATPEDAYRCFMNTEMDFLVLENVLFLKAEQPETPLEWLEKPSEEVIWT